MQSWGYFVPCEATVERIDLSVPQLTIGRSYTCDVVIPHLGIAMAHFSIRKIKRGAIMIKALHTGDHTTIVDDLHIVVGETSILNDGSNIVVGSSERLIQYTYRDFCSAKISVDYKYHLGRILGEGGFGMVRHAICRESKQEYAIKIIVRSGFPSKFYDREIKIMKSIKHPNVVQIQEVFEEGRRIYLVMELLSEGNLLDLILLTGCLNEYDAKQASWNICNGMQYLHLRGIAHRDLKPENILVVSSSPISVKIADFGLAKTFSEGSFLTSVCGTPNHMAPEVWLTRQSEYSLVVDSWSMGVMVFLMLSANFPFLYDDDDISSLADFYKRRQLQWQWLPENTSWRARDFVQRLLVEAPERRLSFEKALEHVWFWDRFDRRNSAHSIISTSTLDAEEVNAILSEGTHG